jgi:hypothetical protein
MRPGQVTGTPEPRQIPLHQAHLIRVPQGPHQNGWEYAAKASVSPTDKTYTLANIQEHWDIRTGLGNHHRRATDSRVARGVCRARHGPRRSSVPARRQAQISRTTASRTSVPQTRPAIGTRSSWPWNMSANRIPASRSIFTGENPYQRAPIWVKNLPSV